MAHEELLAQLMPCAECFESDFNWCGISVRPYCKNCGNWGAVNHYPNGPDVAIKSWNNSYFRKIKTEEAKIIQTKIEKYSNQLKLEISIDDLIEFHRNHCNRIFVN